MPRPSSTYRVQRGTGLGFAELAAVADYVDALGISHLYLSPIATARPGSTHGYDVVAPGEIDPELGGEAGFKALAAALDARNLGILLDVVPNHVCVAGAWNAWWLDVLENGPSSPFAPFFDIDWTPPRAEMAQTVLLPVLGDQYGRELEAGHLRVARDEGALVLDVPGSRLPLAPRSWSRAIAPALERLRARPGTDDAVTELESVLTALSHLPERHETSAEAVRERQREKEVVKRRLAQLFADSTEAARAMDEALDALNGRPGEPSSFDELERLLGEQPYRLAHWRVATDEINYRRFFDVNDLAAIRIELPEVFDAMQGLSIGLVRDGLVDGLRVDHVDGLYDPAGYLDGLRTVPWVVVEKILAEDEGLPARWPVSGTTGYEFLNRVNGLFVEPGSRDDFDAIDARFARRTRTLDDEIYDSKRLVLRVALSSELTALSRRIDHLSEQHRHSRDFTLRSLEHALAEVIACFPVYRTYIGPRTTRPDAHDEAHVRRAVADARRRNPAMSASIFEFLQSVLLLEEQEGEAPVDREARLDFVLRFQQLTGPVMAKGLEDTATYRHHPLASLSEVGATGAWGTSRTTFHAFCAERARTRPLGLSATSTHDSKRDEDVRARLDVLSEIPEDWSAALDRFRLLLRGVARLPPGAAPDGNDESLFYQTLVGAWPPEAADAPPPAGFADRIEAYMLKAIREAKRHTSWINPNPAYEAAVSRFVERALDPARAGAFLDALRDVRAHLLAPGLLNALSQLVLKIAAPGVADVYQGTELWACRLVDPDNRAPVDFALRRARLAALEEAGPDDAARLAALLAALPDGGVKLFVTSRGLRRRRARPEFYTGAAHVPLAPAGPRARHVVAFARVARDASAVAVAGRFFATLPRPPIGAAWAGTTVRLDTALAGGPFRDVFTGREVAVRESGSGPALALDDVFAVAPFALLERT
ncbi:MAG: malto-oligosyltrehalose synthase [Vicinamibacterales bacterium]